MKKNEIWEIGIVGTRYIITKVYPKAIKLRYLHSLEKEYTIDIDTILRTGDFFVGSCDSQLERLVYGIE